MANFVVFLIAGITSGVLFALAATGLVLTYTTSGIFNFAHGGVAMLAAYVFYQMTQVWMWPTWVAFVLVAFILAPLFQIGIYRVIMRRLAGTSEITKIVVTISLMLAMFGLATWGWDQSTLHTIPLFWGVEGEWTFHLGGRDIYLQYFQVFAVVTALILGVALSILFKRTRVGIAMRAVVDSPDLLKLNGGVPDKIAALSWAIGGSMAAVAGILVAQVQGNVDATSLTILLITCGVTAAMIGRLRSIPMTVFGGVLIGLEVSFFSGYASLHPEWTSWSPSFGVAIPVMSLFVVLLVLPQDRLRGATLSRLRERFVVPTMKTSWIAAGVLLAFVVGIGQIMGGSDAQTLAGGMALSIMALSVTLLTGFAGEINLAPISFGAIGAIVAYHHGLIGPGYPDQRTSLWGIFLGIVATMAVGAIVAIPALRLRGLHLALATMAFGIFMSVFVLSFTGIVTIPLLHIQLSFVGGAMTVPPVKLFFWSLVSPKAQLISSTVLFCLLGVGLIAVRRSAYGRRLIAMKDSPAATATLGQNLMWLKISAFMFSSALAAVGGVLYCISLGSVQSTTFDILFSFALVMGTVVGGIGSVSGALLGGVGLGVGLTAIQHTFFNLANSHNDFGQLISWATAYHLAALLPATIGITLGGNPSGSVSNIVESYKPIIKDLPVLIGTLFALGLAYVLTLTHVWGNWWFVFCFGIIGIISPAVAGKRLERGQASPPQSNNVQPEMAVLQ
ncbi:MAG: ABC transporter permease [Actinomycetes bacterium]